MLSSSFILSFCIALILAKWLAETVLALLNRRHVRDHADDVPAAFRDSIDLPTYRKSGEYTLARLQFGIMESAWSVVIVLVVLVTPILPASFETVRSQLGGSAWAQAAWLFLVGIGLSVPALPFEWWAQFKLEERFGFNTTTLKLWCLDRVKGLLLSAAIGYPLLVLILKLVEWMGSLWWVWAWAVLIGFQLLMMVLAPVIILPLFNRLTPLAPGGLRDRLLGLGERTGFSAKTILVMDGSKRSRHSNAFFTGFGKFRKIVLFDTLIQQLREPELEAVLAHEIGHYKRGHIPKMLAVHAASSLAGLAVIAWLAKQPEFIGAFGFRPSDGLTPALMLFILLSGTVTFWLSPLMNFWSREHEYQADAYAATVLNESDSLVGALRKLNEKNLSNLTPHPLYSAWNYSHPTLLERETALASLKLRAESQA